MIQHPQRVKPVRPINKTRVDTKPGTIVVPQKKTIQQIPQQTGTKRPVSSKEIFFLKMKKK